MPGLGSRPADGEGNHPAAQAAQRRGRRGVPWAAAGLVLNPLRPEAQPCAASRGIVQAGSGCGTEEQPDRRDTPNGQGQQGKSSPEFIEISVFGDGMSLRAEQRCYSCGYLRHARAMGRQGKCPT